MNLLDEIIKKINNKTVTTEDFNKLIDESTPESIQNRVRERTRVDPTKSHIEKTTGHQPLKSPTFAARVQPKRQPGNQQNHGRGALGRKHSSDTVKKQYE
jgi:hypothetical protein